MNSTQDPYEVLGVSPDSEEVVIRAAHRALREKYAAGAGPADAWDQQRAADVDAAYAVLRDPVSRRDHDRRREAASGAETAAAAAPVVSSAPIAAAPEPAPAPDPVVPIQVPAGVHPPAATVVRPTPSARVRPPRGAAPPSPRNRWLPGLIALIAVLVIAVVLGWAMSPKRETKTLAAAPGALTVQKGRAPQRTSLARPLPCYVNGQPVGSLLLADCARRNGVATGPLEVGLDSAGPAAPATPAPVAPTPARSALAAAPVAAPALPAPVLPAPAPVAVRPLAAPAYPRSTTADARPPQPPSPPLQAQPAGSGQSTEVVRAFYSALQAGDGNRASALVEPEKRSSGPFAAASITRYFSSLREPLRLTQAYPLDDSTVFVRYEYVTPGGRLCRGAANVLTTERGGQTLIQSVRAHNGC